MQNIGIQWIRSANVDNFTSDFGIVIRSWIGKPLRFILRHATKKGVVRESYPKLQRNVPYVFVSTHGFVDDVASGFGCLDRSAYLLNGAAEAIKHDPKMYAAWLNGTIYVNRLDDESRHSSLDKMIRIIRAGSSVYMYPEGGWNNSENLLCNPLFARCYSLVKETGVAIVPVCTFTDESIDKIYFNVSEPIEVADRTKDEVLREVRDSLATMVFRSMERHTKPLKRTELQGDFRKDFMESRYLQYMESVFTQDVWEEELTVYCDKRYPSPKQVRKSLSEVQITKENAYVMAPILVLLEEDGKWDFKQYMHGKFQKD